MRIIVEKEISNTERESYEFNMFDLTAVFVLYFKEEKPKGKRKWTVTKVWDRYNHRSSQIPEPELPFGISAECRAKVCDLVRVKTWQEFKNI